MSNVNNSNDTNNDYKPGLMSEPKSASVPDAMHDYWIDWGFSEESAQNLKSIVEHAMRADRVLPELPRER